VSGHGHHGQMVDEAAVTLDAERGHVLQLDGNGYVDCGADPAFNLTHAITLSVWIKAKSPDIATFPIIGKGGDAWYLRASYPHRTTHFHTRGLEVTYDTKQPITGDVNITDGHWHHLVSVYDGTQMVLYVDSKPDKTLGADGVLNINGKRVFIGADHDSGQNPGHQRWQGVIDDVRIYDNALSEADVRALYRGEEPAIKNGITPI
ncbi:MAG: LamG domain-containing protein, partial [Phycisphaeraceae bacterium]|nr:LamG domain-containing protein [Phycisphaeraceae bacterium]